jgi:WD40 repeat protein
MNALLSYIEKLLIGLFILGFGALVVIGIIRYEGEGSEKGHSWHSVKKENSIEGYLAFLRDCQSCFHEKAANAALDGLQRAYGLAARLDSGHLAERASIVLPVFAPDGKTVLASGGEGPDFWDALTGARLKLAKDEFAIEGGQRVESLAYAPDGLRVAAGLAGAENGSLLVWDRRSGKRVDRHFIDGYDAKAVVFSPDGPLLGWLASGPVGIWEPGTGKFLRATHEGASALAFARAANGRTVMLTAAGRELWSWDPATMEPVGKAQINSDRALLGLSQDGRLAAYTQGPILELWETRAGTLLATLPEHDSDIVAFCRDPKRGWIVAGTRAGTLYLWDLSAPAVPLGRVPAHEGLVEQLACSAQGRAVSIGWDSAKVWDLEKLRKAKRPKSKPASAQ